MSTYRCPNKTSITRRYDNRERHSALLLRLATSRANPAEDNTIDGVGADGEDDHANISRGGVVDCEAKDEAENGNAFRDRDVPGALVEAAR